MNVLSTLRRLGSSDGYTIPVLVALFLHGLAVLGMVITAPVMTERRITPMPSYIMAKAYVSMPESKPKPVKKPVKKPVVMPQKPPEKKPEKKVAVKSTKEKVPVKPVKSEPDRKKKRAEQQHHEAEQERQAKAERKEAEEAQRLREQEVLAAFERNEREQQQRIAEQLEADVGVVNGYVAIIEQLVRQNWHRPPSTRKGMTVTLRVRLTPTGEIMGIETLQGSVNFAFDEAAIRAVQQAAPFRELGQLENRLFENNFREFNFYFDPQDLLE